MPAQPLPLVDFSTRVKTRPDLPTRTYILAIMLDGLFCSRASPFETGLCTFGRWVGFRFVILIMAMGLIEYFLTIFRKFDDQTLGRFISNAVTLVHVLGEDKQLSVNQRYTVCKAEDLNTCYMYV